MALSRGRERLLRRLRNRRGRAREALVLVEGPRTVSTALAGGARLRFALLTEGATDRDPALAEALEAAGAEVVTVEPATLDGSADTESPQGVLAVAEEPLRDLPGSGGAPGGEDDPPAGGELVLVLDAVQDPGNVGTLVRAAAAFGASRVVALDGTADPWGAKAVRASTGLAFHLPLHRAPAGDAFEWLRARRLPLVVADPAGTDLHEGSVPRGPEGGLALLVGNEAEGPRPAALERADARVALPLAAGVESLNAAMAGTVLLWALGPGRGAGALRTPGGD